MPTQKMPRQKWVRPSLVALSSTADSQGGKAMSYNENTGAPGNSYDPSGNVAG